MKKRMKGLKKDRTKTIVIYPYRSDDNEKFHRATALKLLERVDDQLEEVDRATLKHKNQFCPWRVQEYLVELLADEVLEIEMCTLRNGNDTLAPGTIQLVEE